MCVSACVIALMALHLNKSLYQLDALCNIIMFSIQKQLHTQKIVGI